MKAMELITSMGHEQVVFCQDKEVGLKAIIAIHDTTLGPALGGCRFWNYKNEDEALTDVLRLSRGMTYKAAVAGLHLGGGKAVILGDPLKLKSERFFRSFGRFVNSLGGHYITAEDVNIKVEDIENTAKETRYVSGLSSRPGGSGDPSPITALGVFHGIKASVKYKLKKDSLKGVTIAVQGCGSVGRNLCHLLHMEGAKLIVADINPHPVHMLAQELGAKAVGVDEIHAVDCEVFSPCALGAILNDKSIPQIKASIIAGGANNQLHEENKDGQRLRERGILYAPDYVINAGGLINVACELAGYNEVMARADAQKIYDTLLMVFKIADEKKISTHLASDDLAESRIREAKLLTGHNTFKNSFDNQKWISFNH